MAAAAVAAEASMPPVWMAPVRIVLTTVSFVYCKRYVEKRLSESQAHDMQVAQTVVALDCGGRHAGLDALGRKTAQ